MDKYLLFTPGPVNVAENVRAAIGKEDICHREADFDDLLQSVEVKLLKWRCQKNVNSSQYGNDKPILCSTELLPLNKSSFTLNLISISRI